MYSTLKLPDHLIDDSHRLEKIIDEQHATAQALHLHHHIVHHPLELQDLQVEPLAHSEAIGHDQMYY